MALPKEKTKTRLEKVLDGIVLGSIVILGGFLLFSQVFCLGALCLSLLK